MISLEDVNGDESKAYASVDVLQPKLLSTHTTFEIQTSYEKFKQIYPSWYQPGGKTYFYVKDVLNHDLFLDNEGP